VIFGLLLVLGGAFRSVGRLLNIIFEFGAANPVLMFGLVVIIVVGFAIMTDSPATDVSAAKPACFDEPVPGTWVTTCQKTSNYLATDPYTPSKRPHLFGRSVHWAAIVSAITNAATLPIVSARNFSSIGVYARRGGVVPKFESGEGFALTIPRTGRRLY
jgi:hypothetical protein